MKVGWSSSDGLRFKIGVLGEGYAWIPETPIFTKVSRGRSGKSKVSGSGSVRGTSSIRTLQEVGILPTLVIFHYRGCLVEF